MGVFSLPRGTRGLWRYKMTVEELLLVVSGTRTLPVSVEELLIEMVEKND